MYPLSRGKVCECHGRTVDIFIISEVCLDVQFISGDISPASPAGPRRAARRCDMCRLCSEGRARGSAGTAVYTASVST